MLLIRWHSNYLLPFLLGAIPTKLPGCPAYLSRSDVQTRVSPQSKRSKVECRDLEKAIAESIETCSAYNSAVSFATLAEAFTKVSAPKGWIKAKGERNLCFFYLDESSEIPVVKIKVYVSEDLSVNVLFNNIKANKLACDDVDLIFPVRVTDINFLDKILRYSVRCFNNITQKSGDKIKAKLDFINDILEDLSEEMENSQENSSSDAIKFVQEQIQLSTIGTKTRYRYSCEMMLFSCLLFQISPHAYKFLRGSGKLTLPSPRTIQTICAKFNTDPRYEQSDEHFLQYIKNKFYLLDSNDKIVSLMVDEIHIKPNLDYKGGNIVGGSNNSTERATSAHTFMLNSVRSKYSDVAHILPVHTIKGEDLYTIIKKVIVGLEKIGFEVISVVTDNNALNKKAMSFFVNPPKIMIAYANPVDTSRPLFYVIDPVHTLKNVRNNWINKKPEQIFNFPDFFGNEMRVAAFGALKEMHMRENDQLIKYGHTLSLKALYPSSIERQNVKLVLQVFNDSIVAALEQLGPKVCLSSYKDTSVFIALIVKWWDIVNVKTPLKGQRLRNPFKEPVTINSQHIFDFLQNFLTWLEKWKQSEGQKLTKETHDAVYHTTSALIKISRYCLDVKNFNYLLLGKFQTDKLEERFGKYR